MAQTTYTHWYDVKDYTSVSVTAKTVDTSSTQYTAPVTLIWGQGTNDEPPYDPSLFGLTGNETRDEVARDIMPTMAGTDVKTRQYDTRARWLMFKTEAPADMSAVILSHNFKRMPTQISIRDSGSNDIVQVTNNSAHLHLTDSSGVSINVTGEIIGSTVNSMYVTLADSTGNSLDTVSSTIAVSIRDASNVALASTGVDASNNSLYSVVSNKIGIEQASTQPVIGSGIMGSALYYTLSDMCGVQISTTKNDTCSNALHIHLTDANGSNITSTNRLPLRIANLSTQSTSPFETVVESSMSYATIDLSNTPIQLHSLGIANEFPMTVWLKVYDISTGKVTSTTNFTDYTSNIVYNIPVPNGNFRDLHMSTGVQLNNGLYFRISQDYPYDNSYQSLGPESGRVYVTGTYS